MDPHQPQHRAQIGGDGVGAFALVNTAAAADDHRPDALDQPCLLYTSFAGAIPLLRRGDGEGRVTTNQVRKDTMKYIILLIIVIAVLYVHYQMCIRDRR